MVFQIFLEHKRTVRFIIKGRLRLIAKPSHHLFLGWILPDRVEGFLAAVRLRLFNLYCLGGRLHLQYKKIHSWKSNLLCIVHLYLYVSMTLKQTICMFKFIENWGHPFPLQTTQIFVVPWFHWNVGRTRQFSWRPLEWWHSARPQTPACAPSPENGSSSDTQTNRRAVKS